MVQKNKRDEGFSACETSKTKGGVENPTNTKKVTSVRTPEGQQSVRGWGNKEPGGWCGNKRCKGQSPRSWGKTPLSWGGGYEKPEVKKDVVKLWGGGVGGGGGRRKTTSNGKKKIRHDIWEKEKEENCIGGEQ